MAHFSFLFRRRVQLRHVPHLDRVIPASGDQSPAIGTERQTADQSRVSAEAADCFPGAGVPDLHRAVLTRRGNPSAIAGTEGHGVNVAAVSGKRSKFLSSFDVPDLDGIIF